MRVRSGSSSRISSDMPPGVLSDEPSGAAPFVATAIACHAILLTGRFPDQLHSFGAGVLRWTTRVEADQLLLRDEYPPFSLA